MNSDAVWLGIKIFIVVSAVPFFTMVLFILLTMANTDILTKICNWLEKIVDWIFEFFGNMVNYKKRNKIKKQNKIQSLTRKFLIYEKY